ncbi:MAG: hypothetical protein WB014_02520 [Methanosarcina sp.]
MKLFDEMDLKKSIDIVLTRRRMEKRVLAEIQGSPKRFRKTSVSFGFPIRSSKSQ